MDKEIRAFIGTYIPKDVVSSFYSTILREFSKSIDCKWVEDFNIHFTYQFLGDVEPEELKSIKNLLKEELTSYNFELKLRGIGVFPNINNPKVMFIKIIDDKKVLNQILSNIMTKLSPLGFKSEKEFKPHITLNRIKSMNNKVSFTNSIKNLSEKKFGEITNFNVNLIESKLTPKGPVYKIL